MRTETLAAPRQDDTDRAAAPEQRIERVRRLPGGRAVLGAFLVAASTVGVFLAYLQATAAPTTAYLVAAGSLEPGTRFATLDELLQAVGSTPLELPPTPAGRAIPVEEASGLVGQVLVSPLERGDLLTRTAFVRDGGVADARTLSFSVAAANAVGGHLRAGEPVDVVATHGAGGDRYTSFVVRGVPLLRVSSEDGVVGGTGHLTLTVAVASVEEVLALSHAAATAELRVIRSSTSPAEGSDPGAYRPPPAPASVGPTPSLPEPAAGADVARTP